MILGLLRDAAAPVFLENEELFHPVAVGLSNVSRRNEREPSIAAIDESNVSKEALCEYVFVEVVPELASRIQILVPDVRQLVLIELQHPANRSEVVHGGNTALTRQWVSPLGVTQQ